MPLLMAMWTTWHVLSGLALLPCHGLMMKTIHRYAQLGAVQNIHALLNLGTPCLALTYKPSSAKLMYRSAHDLCQPDKSPRPVWCSDCLHYSCPSQDPVCTLNSFTVCLAVCTMCDVFVVQHEISLDAYNRLTSTPDAKGRTIEVIKVPIPYPLFRTYKEANGVHVSPPSPPPFSYPLPPYPTLLHDMSETPHWDMHGMQQACCSKGLFQHLL